MPPRKKEVAFLDLTVPQFQDLSDQKATELLRAQTILNTQRASHARLGIILGTITYAISIAGCICLALYGFPKLAAACLGTPVLSVVKRLIDSRLN